MIPRAMRDRLFEEQSVLLDRTMKRYSNMICACHLCKEDVRQELALQMLLLLEKYDPSRCPNLGAYLSLYLRYALFGLTLPRKRYGISQVPAGQKVQVVSLEACCDAAVSKDPNDVIEIWEEISALPSMQQTAIRRRLYGERLHRTNKAIAASRRHLRWYTGGPESRYQLKKEREPHAKAEE